MMRAVFFLIILLSTPASARSIETINAEKAREVAREQVVWRDRLCPFSTFAQDFLLSVYGQKSYKGLSPEQVVYGWLLRPEVWKDEPMILVPDADLCRQLQIEGDYARFSDLFDDTLGYKLNALGSDLPEAMRQLVRQSPAAVRLDERVGEIILLTRGQLFQPRPAEMAPLSSWRVEAEILWNHIPLAFVLLTIAAAVLFVLSLRQVFKVRSKARLRSL